jgi:transcriptional regulator with XRE-family HTH domain
MKNDLYYYEIARKNIRYFRKMKGFTYQKIADETGLSLEYVQQICSLKLHKTFSLAVLGRIADVLDVPIYEMLQDRKD